MKLARRNIIHRHARLRSGAGTHKVKPRVEVTAADWDDYGDNEMEMTLEEFRKEHSISNGTELQDALQEWVTDTVVPALCKGGCEVSPDGKCEHGNPSILVRMGVI